MDRPPSVPRVLDAVVIALAAAVMIAWTWRTWPDPLVDFGRELYVPWRLSAGQVLYRDIAYFNGVFSPYLNALWMRALGASLTALIIANLAIVAVVLALLYALINLVADRFTAVAVCLFFVAVFCCGRIVGIGNYNFICPYSHEITHGIALSLGALACLFLPRKLGNISVAAAGFLTGLALLTKVEVAVACVTAVFLGFALRAASGLASRLRLTLLLVMTTAVPVATAFLLLFRSFSAKEALQGTLGSFFWTFHSNVASSVFYRHVMGLDDFRSNLFGIVMSAVLLAVAPTIAIAAGALTSRVAWLREFRLLPPLVFFVTAILALSTRTSLYWFNVIPKALPLAMVVLAVFGIVIYSRTWKSDELSRITALRLTLAVFAAVLLLKILFNTRLYHYGFALAMPAMLLLIAAFLCWIPASSGEPAARCAARSVGLALVVVMTCIYVSAIASSLRKVRQPVGSGPDLFYADERGRAVTATLDWLSHHSAPASTVAVMPEGTMINYLSRRPNPSRYIILMPPEVSMFGEERIVDSFQSHAPDYVILVQTDISEYGLPLFGHDYARKIAAWVRGNYHAVALLGDPPFVNPNRFGILILQQNAAAGAGASRNGGGDSPK